MPRLSWKRWHRSDGCKKWMDKTMFAGTSFTNIFYQGMRLVFLDENGNPGLLYRGEVFEASKVIVAANGKVRGFIEADQLKYLFHGDFKYDDHDSILPFTTDRLLFQGPDSADLNTPKYAEGTLGGQSIDIHFYNIIKDAREGAGSFRNIGPVPETAEGISTLAYFTAAVVLHEIMHNHNFDHPKNANWQLGSDYTSTLPQVALQSVLEAARKYVGKNSLPLATVERYIIEAKWNNDWNDLGGKFDPGTSLAAVSWGPGRFDIFALSNNAVYHKAWDGAKDKWNPSLKEWNPIGGKFDPGSSLAAVSWGTGRFDIFALSNNAVFHKAWDAAKGGWNPSLNEWNPLGGKFDPGTSLAAVSWGPGRFDIFALSNNAVYHKAWDAAKGGWNPSLNEWNPLGGKFDPGTSLSAVSWGPGRFDVFALSGNAVYHKAWDAAKGGWNPSLNEWNPLGGKFDPGTSLAAVSWGPGRFDVFALSDNAVYHKAWDAAKGGWNPSLKEWNPLGGKFDPVTSLAAVSWRWGRFDIFALSNNAVYHKAWDNNSGWQDWQLLGGKFDPGTSLAAVSWGPGRLDILALANQAVWHKSRS